MKFGVKRSAAAVARPLRKGIPARGWRRYAVGGLVVVSGAFGTVAAVSAPAAQAAHVQTVQTAHHTQSCAPPASPYLAGFKQGMVSIPGDSLHYVKGGSGPVLVLIHGWPMTWWEWHTVMPSLAKTHTVIAFDLPGLGDSTTPTSGGYTAADTATRLHEAINALGYNQISILSHDLGVNVAYAYTRLYASSVTKLAVLESLLNGYGLESIYAFSFHFDLNMAASPTPEDIINDREAEVAYLNYLYTFAQKPGAITNFDKATWYDAYSCPANREAGYNYYRAFPDNETWNIQTNTSKLTVPVLAMGGEDSFGTEVGTSMENVDSDVSTVVAPGSGHYIPEEDPGYLSECAGLFFSSATSAPSGYTGCASN